MKTLFTSVVGGIALLSGAFAAVHAQASNNDHQVQCVDGTVYILNGDEITDEVACAHHGGVSPAAVIVGGTQIKTNHGIAPEPLKKRPQRASR